MFRHHGRRRSPSLRGSWPLGDSLPFSSLIFSHPPLPTPPLPRLPPRHPTPLSHDETHTRYLDPDYPAPSSSSSDTQSPGSSSRGDGPFDPGNTPPLVFAFIAVGFIIFGVIVAIIYRKCRPLPNSPQSHYQRSPAPSTRPSLQKPTLWDIWIAPSQPVAAEERANMNDWETFVVSRALSAHALSSINQLTTTQPLSTSLVYPYSPSSPVRVPQQYVQGHVVRAAPSENPEHRLFFRHPPADTNLHVAVMVSMPKPSRDQKTVPNRTHTESEFHVGVTQVKWSG